ncbi:MAG: hypothetical protein IE914_08995 [Thiotrichales bacterium]|nr:hypothetical protein [Thiotrichales bacterium]
MKTSIAQTMTTPFSLAISAIFASGLSSQVLASSSFNDALTSGKPSVDINLRYESVNDASTPSKSATALTERTRLGYLTGDYKGLSGFVEYSGVETLTPRSDYHVGAGVDADTNTSKSVIADPTLTRLNQAWIHYKLGNLDTKLGKQRIIMDARFLGNVGWRQTEQVYTGLRLTTKPSKAAKIDYAYLSESDNIFGIKTPMATHALKLDYKLSPAIRLAGYGYLIDNDNSTSDSATYGLRAKGAVPLSSIKLLYQAEYASQGNYADSKGVSASYTHLLVGMKLSGIVLAIAQEKLGGDGTYAFQTPLATKHAYNGWADKFLTTPATGLIDNYLKVATKVKGIKLAGFYHDFSADKGGANLGSELDLVAATKLAKIYKVGIKYAGYSKGSATTGGTSYDTSKLWIWGGVKF